MRAMHTGSRKRGRRRGDDVPFTPPTKPLADCRLALLASSVCLARRGQGADPNVAIGDPRWRAIAGDADTGELLDSAARGADTGAANLDRNVAYALDRLREAESARRIGALNRRHLALCGPMAATRRAIVRAAPRATELLTADGVDVVLLVPT
jgi:hypothetical protein